jgi:hypothetical protein
VVKQFIKDADCDDEKMKAYCAEARKLEPKFEGLELRHILQRYNDTADKLVKLGSARDPVPTGVFVNCSRPAQLILLRRASQSLGAIPATMRLRRSNCGLSGQAR